MNQNIFKLDISWKELMLDFLNGKCPIKWPNHEFMWKCKPVKNLNDKFVCKFIKSSYPKKQDLNSFSKKFNNCKKNKVIAFNNLSGSTRLVVPCPSKDSNYSNLYTFLQTTNKEQKKNLWKKIGKEFCKIKNKDNTIWLSTHGHGINYLHVRIKQSKDYGYPINFD